MYARISRRPTRAAGPGSACAAEAALDRVAVIGFKDSQAGVEQFAFRDDHDVVSGRDLVTTENLSNQTLGAISLDRSAQLLRRGDTEPPDAELVGPDEHRAETAVNVRAILVHLLEFDAAANPFVRTEAERGQAYLLAADGQPLAALGATALEHQATIFRRHAHQESMRPLPVARVRLERSFPLHQSLSDGRPVSAGSSQL